MRDPAEVQADEVAPQTPAAWRRVWIDLVAPGRADTSGHMFTVIHMNQVQTFENPPGTSTDQSEKGEPSLVSDLNLGGQAQMRSD